MAFIPSYWRERAQRYRYEGSRCKETGEVFFPPRRTASPFAESTLEPYTLATTGKVLSYTVIRVPPTQFVDEAPYAVAICEMDGGGRITAQLVDCPLEDIKIGMRVRIEFRLIQKDSHHGILMYGYKVVPE